MFKSNAISTIVALVLITIIGIQTWYMVGMKNQLDSLSSDQPSNQIPPKDTTTPTAKSQSTAAVTPDQHKKSVKDPLATNSQSPRPLDNNLFNKPFDAQTWDPFEEIQRMQRNMDKMFNESFDHFNQSPDFKHLFKQSVTAPKLDLREDNKQYTVIVDLPGTDMSNIAVSLDDKILTIKGQQDFTNEKQDSNGNAIFRERRSGSFERSITLPGPVRQNGMQSMVDNGVLEITIPKA